MLIDMTNNFLLKGLTCGACIKLITIKLKKIPGVTEIKIDLATGKTQVEADRQIDLPEIKQTLHGTDFSVSES